MKVRKKPKSDRVAPIATVCPEHNRDWNYTHTQYGLRASCPVVSCTYVYWPKGPTSTPANAEMRAARMEAHEAFDAVWKLKLLSRNQCYKRLRDHMGLTTKQTHIGMFDVTQANTARDFALTLRKELEGAAAIYAIAKTQEE